MSQIPDRRTARRDGRRAILRDPTLPANEEAWEGATRIEGLQYDG